MTDTHASGESEEQWRDNPLTGGLTEAIDKSRGIGNVDCGHNDWGYYPPLQEIYILWCRTCGTIKQCIPSADQMDIVGARYLSPTVRAQAGLIAEADKREYISHRWSCTVNYQRKSCSCGYDDWRARYDALIAGREAAAE